jgi:hypothetical protein
MHKDALQVGDYYTETPIDSQYVGFVVTAYTNEGTIAGFNPSSTYGKMVIASDNSGADLFAWNPSTSQFVLAQHITGSAYINIDLTTAETHPYIMQPFSINLFGESELI